MEGDEAVEKAKSSFEQFWLWVTEDLSKEDTWSDLRLKYHLL